MDYDKLTDDEALDILEEHDEAPPREEGTLWDYIEEPAEVLRWLDADGDFELAVMVQGLPPETPIEVARGLKEANHDQGLDLLEHLVDLPAVEEHTCAGCGSELFEFEHNPMDSSWSDSFWISEYGDYIYDEMEFLSDPAAPPYWQADEDGPHLACDVCHIDGIVEDRYHGPAAFSGERAFRIYDGQTGLMSQYTTGGQCGTVVRDDWYWDSMADDDWVPAGEILPEPAEVIFRARDVDHDLDDVLGHHGWTPFTADDIIEYSTRDDAPEHAGLNDSYRGKKNLKEIITDWSNADEPHPSFDFPYAIDKGSEVWVHATNLIYMMDELIMDTLRMEGRTAGLENHRDHVEKKRFTEAAHDGTYAELSLPTGDVLLTGYEGEEHDEPHFRVVPMGDHGDAHPTDILRDVSDAIEAELDTHVNEIRWDNDEGVFPVEMDQPDQ